MQGYTIYIYNVNYELAIIQKGYSALQYALMKESEDEKDDKNCREKNYICTSLIERGAQINCKNEQVT